MTFKIAYCAGHYLGTPGKRVPKELDPVQNGNVLSIEQVYAATQIGNILEVE